MIENPDAPYFADVADCDKHYTELTDISRYGVTTPAFFQDRFCSCGLDEIQTGLQDHAGTGERPARNG